jgi:hypothetical protein
MVPADIHFLKRILGLQCLAYFQYYSFLSWDFDNAFKYLERARNTQNEGLKYNREYYFFGIDFWADPRYKDLLRKLNLPDKQIKWSLYDHLKSKEKNGNILRASILIDQ